MKTIRTSHGWARAVALLALASLTVAGVQASTVTAAHASTTNDTVMVTTQRMAGPTLNTTQVGWYSQGSHLNLQCYARGQSVKGYYSPYIPGGWDNLWYKVSDGYWVADVDINTGSNNPVTPLCQSGTTATRAVAWANSQVGSMGYPGLCELFVENAYGTSGRYASAIAAYYALRAAGQIHTSSTGIPAGALVFSSNRAWDLGYGHVMLSRGDGTFVSGGAWTGGGNHTTVQIFSSPAPSGGYLGWAYAPTSWPGR